MPDFRQPPPDPPVEVVRSTRRRKTITARLVEGRLKVMVPAGMDPEEERRTVDRLVARMRRRLTASRIDLVSRAEELGHSYDLPRPDSIEWSERQNTRWGSCTAPHGAIRISGRLALVPGWVLDYVILHELCHLVEPNHGLRFQRLLSRYPKAERAKGYLMALTEAEQNPALVGALPLGTT